MRLRSSLTNAHRRSAERFPFMPRRGLAAIDPDVARTALRVAVAQAESAPITLGIDNGSSVGFTAVAPDPWASDQLEFTLHRVMPVVSDGPDRETVVRGLLVAAVDASEADLLSLQVHGGDHVTLGTAQSVGFQVVDLELSYTSDAALATPTAPAITAGLEVSVHGPTAGTGICPADRASLLDAAGTHRMSHLGADHRINPERTAAFYRRWTANAVDGTWGDRLVVARLDSTTVGIYSWVLDKEIERACGTQVFHRSWAVVTRPGIGVMNAMVRTAMGGGCDVRFTECETQASNAAVQRSLHRLGAIKAIEPVYVLHRWN